MYINLKDFKHKIIIEIASSEKINGIPVTTWNDFCKCRAKIINNITTEQDNGQEIISRDNKKLYIRYSKQLDTMEQNIKSKKYRLTYNGKAYNILSFSNVQEENKYFEIITERVGTLI